MDAICTACKQAITSARVLYCAWCNCAFHPICVNLGSSDTSKLKQWQCPQCKAKEPKGNNCNTPVHATYTVDIPTANAPSRAQKRLALSSPNGNDREDFETDPVASELRLLRLDIADVKSCLVQLTEAVSKNNCRLDGFETRLTALEEKDFIISTLSDAVQDLQSQMNEIMQSALKNEVEIIGIDETSNESLEHLVMVTATKVGVNLPESDIDWVTRVGPKNGKDGKVSTTPRPIIVRLTRKAKRDEFLKAAKLRRNLVVTSADLDLLGPPRKVYINEHLSKIKRKLFRESRLRAKELGYRFCWVNNGKILVRREEGKPAISIKTSEDLARLPPRNILQTQSTSTASRSQD